MLERICEFHLKEGILKTNPLCEYQHAYRSGRSIESALHNVVTKIEKSLAFCELTLGAFLDIEGAFDRVDHNIIMAALKRKGVDDVTSNWLCSLLTDREISVTIGGREIIAAVHRGCPQGGILSPLFWSLAVEELLVELNERKLYAVGYADDIAIVISGIDYSTVCNRMQQAYRIVEEWCNRSGLGVNPEKTNLVLFTNRRKVKIDRVPILYGKETIIRDRVKYLGVILDKKLKWNFHLEEKVNTALRSLWQCRRMIGKTWGLSPKVMHFIYTQVVRPVIGFASVVWWPRVKLKCTVEALNRFQRHACLAITGALRSTPTAALEVLLNLLPLHIFIEQEALKCAIRLRNRELWNDRGTLIGHRKILKDVEEIFPSTAMLSDVSYPKEMFSGNIEKIRILTENDELYNCVEEISRCNVKVFTDGSVQGLKAGAGVFWMEENIEMSIPLGQYFSIVMAEIFAILMAMCCLCDRGVTNKTIGIISDSKNALQKIAEGPTSSNLVQEARYYLAKLLEDNEILFIWVPGHSDILGNEISDRLAKLGVMRNFVGPEPVIGIELEFIKRNIQEYAQEIHRKYWKSVKGCLFAKSLVKSVTHGCDRQLLALTRTHLRVIIGILTRHWLNAHLHKMGMVDDPICPWCSSSRESVKHILCDCPTLALSRQKILGKRVIDLDDLSIVNVKNILSFTKENEL
ncbi:uncharacterized protein LOC129809388 [Phlebotomus papatasi]|uniref:uncharacterized protein LOC129809388 n=1 Tax=Phlebotomus papatasi TaxID=29031 RepID=UPI00248336F2|nr:uncharacterized protein LOC129809388 [Phlebotomus papatasi]